jgi:hypothetical protein
MSLMGLLFGNTTDPIKLYYGFASSMQKEFNRADDGTILSEKHTFNIRGAIVPSPVGTNKLMPSGAFDRYSSLVGSTSRDIIETDTNDFIVGRLWNLRAGPLRLVKLTPDPANPGQYIPSGMPVLEYKFAQLNNISIGEAPEDTAGIHFQEVTMAFEAITGPRTDPSLENTYRLKAAAEQFEIKKEEDRMSYFIFDGIGADKKNEQEHPYYSYTITHTISAQGLPLFYNDFPSNQTAIQNNADAAYLYDVNSGNYNYTQMRTPATPDTAKNYPKFEAFYEAYNYIQRKKRNSLLGSIIYTDIHGKSYLGSNAFMPTAWDIASYEAIIPSTTINEQGTVIAGGPNGDPLPIPDGKFEQYATEKYGNTFKPRASGERPLPASGAMISQNLWDSGVYGEYNVVRTSTVDMIAGSYSLTTTYFYSRSPATIEINGSYEKGEDGNDTVRVEGTITGLDSRGVSADSSNKYTNAKNVFYTICKSGINTQDATTYIKPSDTNTVYNNNGSGIASPSAGLLVNASGWPFNNPLAGASGISPYGDAGKTFAPWGIGTSIFTFANKIFQDNSYTPFYNSNMVLDIRPISTSITENKVGGTIQFSATYKPIPKTIRDIKLKIPNCIAVSLNVQDDNKYRKLANVSAVQHSQYTANAFASGIQTAHIVPVMVLGRNLGPILQNMSTTKQAERKVVLEATVDVAERYPESLCILSGIAVALDYYPPNTANFYLTELQDTWDWANGKITVNVGWTYTR